MYMYKALQKNQKICYRISLESSDQEDFMCNIIINLRTNFDCQILHWKKGVTQIVTLFVFLDLQNWETIMQTFL